MYLYDIRSILAVMLQSFDSSVLVWLSLFSSSQQSIQHPFFSHDISNNRNQYQTKYFCFWIVIFSAKWTYINAVLKQKIPYSANYMQSKCLGKANTELCEPAIFSTLYGHHLVYAVYMLLQYSDGLLSYLFHSWLIFSYLLRFIDLFVFYFFFLSF